MTEVKPCPFCGSSEFEIRERVMEGKKGYPVTLLHWCYHDRAHANKPIGLNPLHFGALVCSARAGKHC